MQSGYLGEVSLTGPRTYSASIIGAVPALLPTDIFTLTGAANIIVKVTRVLITGSRSANATSDFVFVKRSTANTLGTPSVRAAVPYDSNSVAASAICQAYTANPTLGALVGNLLATRLFLTGVSGTPPMPLDIAFGNGIRPSTPVILRGANEVFAINLNGVTITAPASLDFTIEWTEEPT